MYYDLAQNSQIKTKENIPMKQKNAQGLGYLLQFEKAWQNT